jgi:hypothetical protein
MWKRRKYRLLSIYEHPFRPQICIVMGNQLGVGVGRLELGDQGVSARGGGTSQSGQTVNSTLIVDCSKYLDRVLELPHPDSL